MRLIPISRGALCTVLLMAGLSFGTAALAQVPSNSPADRDMADRYYRAAQAGDDQAQFYLGSLYSAGVGRPQSDTDAFAWIERAAQRGNAQAMLVAWIERAAQRGNAQAMLVAAGLTALGKGTPKDYVVSYKWAFLVAEGSQLQDMKNGGRQLITMLEPRMSPDQIQSAKTQAYQFRAIGTGTPAPASAPAPAVAAPRPLAVAPPPPAPALQAPSLQAPAPPPVATAPSAAPAPQPAATASSTSTAAPSSSIEDEARKHLGKDNMDKLLKNVPPVYRKRFGL